MDSKEKLENHELRSWTIIDFKILDNNLRTYLSLHNYKHEIIAVVKADAYGHGDQIVSKQLFKQGVNFFAVSNIDETIRIRNAGGSSRILILGFPLFKE